MRSRIRGSVWAVLPLVLLAACTDEGPTVPANTDVVPLEVSANLSGTPVQTLVVEVTAPDITTPLAYNLHVNNGQASGSIQVPPGSARMITVRAFDVAGTVTHEGSATVNVSRGNNPPVQIPLVPRSGHQPIDLTLAEVSITIAPGSASLASGETLQLTATVVAAGAILPATVAWATLNPAIASVDADGLVSGLASGTVTIVATYAGVGAAATVTVDPTLFTWFIDADGDGYGDPATGIVSATHPAGYVAAGGDCDDSSADTYPGAVELADGVDNDCNGVVDDTPLLTWYADMDGDGYGNAQDALLAPEAPAGYVADASDCDDASASVYPGATEVANGTDDDCDGEIDEGVLGLSLWYLDADQDGYGEDFGPAVSATRPSPSYSAQGGDCQPFNPSIHPGAVEILDGTDNNCDTIVDNVNGPYRWFQDLDGDQWGDSFFSTTAQNQPFGFVGTGGDCNDSDASIYPGAAELANGFDDDCDTVADDGL